MKFVMLDSTTDVKRICIREGKKGKKKEKENKSIH
jgi:hypothetical protein